MNVLNILRICVLACCFASSAHATTQVQEITSPGGIRAWLVEEHTLPLVAIKIAFTESGTAYDPQGLEGRTGLVAAMLMEGAGNLDSRAFNESLENDAAELNFGADEDTFRASLETLSEKKEEAFSYLGMALSKPRFDNEAIARVKSQALSILVQQEKEPGYLMERGWQKMAFGAHPYGSPALGTKEAIDAMQAATFRDYVSRYLTKENMLISVVGDITPAELGKLLDANLGSLPAHYSPDVTLTDIKLPQKGAQNVIDTDIPQTMVSFGTEGLKRDDPDYYAAYVMNQILGGGGNLGSVLAQEIREKRGLAYTVYTQLEPMKYAAQWHGGFATRSEEVGNALATLKTTLKNFVATGASDAQVSDAKQYLTGSFVLNLDSNSTIADFLISMQINHLGRDYMETRNGKIAAVTTSQVNAVAKKIIDPDNLLVVMVGKPNLNVTADANKQ